MQFTQLIFRLSGKLPFDKLATNIKYSLRINKPSGEGIIQGIRQSCDYSKAYELYLANPSDFAIYMNPPWALAKTEQCLKRLFNAIIINNRLLNICRFRAHREKVCWTTIETFCGLLNLVPKELTSALSRLDKFWEDVADLTKLRSNIYADTRSINKISGLWPKYCSADKEKLCSVTPSLFPMISKKEKEKILKYIEQSDIRVPTMELMISEMKFFYSIAKKVNEILKADGNGLRLEGSQIKKDESVEVDRKTYLLYFLQAAQYADVKKASCNVAKHHDLRGPTTECRKINENSKIWESGTPAELFNETMLETLKPDYVEGQLPACLLVMDFLESFFGFSVSQCLTEKASQDQVGTLSVRHYSFNTHTDRSIYHNGLTTSLSASDYSSYGSQFIVTPFSENPKIRDYQSELRPTVVENQSPKYKSRTTYIETLEISPRAHLIKRLSVRDTLDSRKQDVKRFLHQKPPLINQDSGTEAYTQSCASTIVNSGFSPGQSIYSDQLSPIVPKRGSKEYGPFLPKRVKDTNKGTSPRPTWDNSQITLVNVELIAQNHGSETLLTIQEDKILRVRIKKPTKKSTVGQTVNDKTFKTSVLTTKLASDSVSSLRTFVGVEISKNGDKLTSTWGGKNKT